MADLLANINEIDHSLRLRQGEMTDISHRIQDLQKKQKEISIECENLREQKRTLGLEQYKDREVRRGLLMAGRQSGDTHLIVLAIQLEKQVLSDQDDLSDEAINFFVAMENANRQVTNTNMIGKVFGWFGKIGYRDSAGEIYNDN